ncbi:heme NO-binding domain-containing protein [Hirschia litorea]|uniref:Heme NO-binding domain-containing protein n=1 Tax=Hirschia litorea TaxID=1199156 RepID=A0ABW2IHX5_9PROT
MQGMIFTEFLKMVDIFYSPEVTERIIKQSNTETNGAYTSVGNYSHSELVSMVVALSEEDETPVQDLVRAFGKFLLGQFCEQYPGYFLAHNDIFSFLDHIGNHVHTEVMKLYPDSRPPMIETTRLGLDIMELLYSSHRELGDAAHGLIEGALEYFETEATIQRNQLIEGEKTCIRFLITRTSTQLN